MGGAAGDCHPGGRRFRFSLPDCPQCTSVCETIEDGVCCMRVPYHFFLSKQMAAPPKGKHRVLPTNWSRKLVSLWSPRKSSLTSSGE